MLNLLSSRISFTGNFRRSGLPSFHCSARIGANDALNGLTSAKESDTVVIQNDTKDFCSLSVLPVEAVADDVVHGIPPTVGKPKKNKLKTKKCADVPEEISDQQNVVSDGTELMGKKCKRGSHNSQITRSEDVEGHCGNFPVDDLVEFIYSGRKLNRAKSKPLGDDELSPVNQKSVAIKMRSSSYSAYYTMEDDSGFGDLESCDRGDSVISDDSISPPILSSTESSETMEAVPVVDTEESSAQAEDTKLGSARQDSSIRVSGSRNDNSAQVMELPSGCFENDEIAGDGDFVVVRQKKRRSKPVESPVSGDFDTSGQAVQPSRLHNGSSHSAIALHDKFNHRSFISRRINSRLSSPDTIGAGHDIEVKTSITRRVVSGDSYGSNFSSISSTNQKSSNCAPSNFNRTRLNEVKSSPVMNRQVVLPSIDRNSIVTRETENFVATADVGTMTVLDVVPKVEHPTFTNAACKRLSVGSTNRHLESMLCTVEKVDVSLRNNSSVRSNSCPSTSSVSRTQSPCSSCDCCTVSEPSVSPQRFDLNATQSFLFKAYQNALQMRRTHPHSVQFYRPEMVSMDVSV